MTKRLGIIGYPVGHSLSPAFQQAALEACGVDARYERWETPPERLAARVEGLRAPDVLGANVTIPYKEAVIPYLDDLDPFAELVGAVNTIVVRGGRLLGFNTDGPGFVRALEETAGFVPSGRSVLVVGSGGAGRGIAFALARAGVERLAVWNRTASRAERLLADIRSRAAGTACDVLGSLEGLEQFDLVVNCTAVGMAGSGMERTLPFDPAATKPDCLVADIVYKPERTPLLAAAAAAGRRTLGGLPMLVYQGALAFELWTGLVPPVDVMFAAVRAAVAAQASP